MEGGRERGVAAEDLWAWYSKPPRAMATASAWGSADGCARMKSLPPVSPTMRGYVAYVDMFAPIVFHMLLNTCVLPVKCTPASSRCDNRVFEISAASPGTKLMTPGGRPAASSSFMM